jgi:RNA polymerase sigma-70 factor, ECF subfamily
LHGPSLSVRGLAESLGRLIAESRLVPDRFGVVFDRHAAAIHGYIARRLGRDAADDLVGETLLVAFGRRDGYDPEQPSARPWLYGSATRLVSRRAPGGGPCRAAVPGSS